MNCAEAMIKYLVKRGTPFVTGVPGGTNLPLYDALYKSPLRHVLARHEQGAGFIAQGYSRVTHRAGVVFATSGPGALNLMTAVGDAFMDSVPMVAVTGQVGTALSGTDAFQEADTTGIAVSVTKHCYYISSADSILDILHEAFTLAESGRPGPVLIDFPKDIQLAEYTGNFSWENMSAGPENRADETDIFCGREILQNAAAMIEASKRPLILAGGGVRGERAVRAVTALSEKYSIPVARSLMAPHIPSSCEIGMPGMHGFADTQNIIETADLVIALGLRFDDRLTGAGGFAGRAGIIHVDIDPCEFDKIRSADLAVHSDAALFAEEIASMMNSVKRQDWTGEIRNIRSDRRRPELPDNHPGRFLERLASELPEGSIVVTDVGQHQMWAAQYMDRSRMERFLTSGGMGTMGFGLPAAIGAALARPDSKVVLITGDGSLLMNLQELATAAEENCNISIAVLNNGSLGLVRQQQNLFYGGRYSASTLGSCNFSSVAGSFGITAFRCQMSDADPVMICGDGLMCFDILTDADKQVLPMVAPGASNLEMIGADNPSE